MRQLWTNLNEIDQAAFRTIIAFLEGRLEERATIDWALGLKPQDMCQRLALLSLLDTSVRHGLREPWQSAWRLIEESWSMPEIDEHTSTGDYDVQYRLRGGDRSGALVTAIVSLVEPRLKIEALSDMHFHSRKLPKHPKKVDDLFVSELTSGRIHDPEVLEIETLTDVSFLVSLALALDAAVVKGLDIARRIGWNGERHFWQIGGLNRVYYVPATELAVGEDEPDIFHEGIAPSVKLLHAVVSHLSDIDNDSTVEFARRWKAMSSPRYLNYIMARSSSG